MNAPADKSISLLIKEKARALGFDLCGIAKSKILADHEPVLRNWCSSGMNGEMKYLGNNIEKRINPGILLPGTKSVIVTGLNYYTERKQGGNGIPLISRYAYGVNYHSVIKDKLNKLLVYVKSIDQKAEGRSYVDSAPVLEKAWTREAGLGWPGRHSVMINNKIGSFFFIGVLLLNTEMDYDMPFSEDYCGTCRLCIESCPTGAINENRTIDVRRCIASLTIENKDTPAEDIIRKLEGRVFGCDKCQEVCPWNKNAQQHKTPEFNLSSGLLRMSAEDWKYMSKDQFKRLFKGSAIERRTYDRFMQNVKNVIKS
jgi:epoxyqueuosine reductase